MTRRELFQSATTLAAGVVTIRAEKPKLALTSPFSALPASAWHNARDNGLVMIWPDPPPEVSRVAHIAGGERGQPLTVQGQVFAPDGQTAASGVIVYAYNTDAEGYYGARYAEYPPRLHGWMRTGNAGSFELHTIQPGRYPKMRVPAHIHFVLWGGGYPLQWVDELRFSGDSYLTGAMLAKAKALGAFSTVQPLTRAADGGMQCAFKIRLGTECNFR